MSNPIQNSKLKIVSIINSALEKAISNGELPNEAVGNFLVEIPNDTTHGDFACNVALMSAKTFRLPPRKIAETICQHIDLENSGFSRFEVAGAGFINFFLGDVWFSTWKLSDDSRQRQGENH